MVEAMAGFGIPEDKMCQVLRNPYSDEPISGTTLRKHFRSELDSGHAKADTMVATGLFKNATTATPTYPGGIPVAQIFWLKTRARWRTVDKEPALPAQPEPLTPEQADDRETVRRLAFLLERGAASTTKAKKKAASRPEVAHPLRAGYSAPVRRGNQAGARCR